MTRHDIAARANFWAVSTICFVALGAAIASTQHKVEADKCAARQHVVKQAKAAAQPDAWAKLDADGRRMTGYDGIGK